MTARQRRIQLALWLYRFYNQMLSKEDRNGMQLYTFTAPGSTFFFKNKEEIRDMARRVARSK